MRPGWWANRAKVSRPGQPDERTLRLFRKFVQPIVRWAHRPTLDGADNLPVDGPFMLVANHSAAAAAGEVMSFVSCYLAQVGADRPLAGMAHPFGFSIWPISTFMRGVGAIPSTYEAAESALRAGIPVLVFPGGDYESTRPIWQANQVMFGGRRGFLRIARRARVSIVPMGIRGSHYSLPILWRSRLLAWIAIVPRLIGLKRFPMTVLGVLGAAALALGVGPKLGWPATVALIWIWLASPLPLLPWVPSTIRLRIGKPISPEQLFADPRDDSFDRAYETVQSAVQQLVTSLGRR